MDSVWLARIVLLVALAIYEQIESPHAEEMRRQLSAWRAEGSGGNSRPNAGKLM
jgi:hypothetical protein